MLLHGSAILSQPLRERMEDGKTQETGARAAKGRPDTLKHIPSNISHIPLLFISF